MEAMRDEDGTPDQELRLDTLPKPYFIAYRVTEVDGVGASARLGGLLTTAEGRGSRLPSGRGARRRLRVRQHQLFRRRVHADGVRRLRLISLDDDYQEIRRQIWLSTDRAYKQAVEALSQKRAALQTRTLAPRPYS
jgi:hypothetical protein